jgi:hypothetical protein
MKDLNKAFRSRFFFGQAGVLQYCLIGVLKISVRPNRDNELRYCIDDCSKLSFGFGYFVESLCQRRLRSLSLDRNYGYVTCGFDQSQITLAWDAGLCVVHSEGAEHLLSF